MLLDCLLFKVPFFVSQASFYVGELADVVAFPLLGNLAICAGILDSPQLP